MKENKDIYEIHVSRFDVSTKEEDITEHIMMNTRIASRELFKVHKLISKDTQTQDYTTFKITTLANNIYEMIMEERIWAPDFKAREYMKSNKGNEMNKYGNYKQNRENKYKRSYEYTKPKNYNYKRFDSRKGLINRPNEQNSMQNTPRPQSMNNTPKNKQNRNINNGQQSAQNVTPRNNGNNGNNFMNQNAQQILQYQQPHRIYYQAPQMLNTQHQNFPIPQQRQMTMRYQ